MNSVTARSVAVTCPVLLNKPLWLYFVLFSVLPSILVQHR